MVRVAFIIPFKEKMSIEVVSIEIKLFIFNISSEKQIFSLNKSSPIPRNAKVILETKSSNNSIKKYEELIQMQNITHLKTNCVGDSICLYVKWEKIYIIE